MRIIALGDTHGRKHWKQITIDETFDKVVFIGDYFDTHENISAQQQKDNFKDIIAYKKANMDKVVLLFGNHDFHYLRGIDETYSGFQMWQKTDIQEMLHAAIDEKLMQMCFAHGHLLFSHAGVTKTWCQNNGIELDMPEKGINELFEHKPSAFKFTPGANRSNTGDDVEQSPIWVRPQSLLKDAIDGLTQVVGHPTQRQLWFMANLVLIDTLGTSAQYLIYDDFELSAGIMQKHSRKQ